MAYIECTHCSAVANPGFEIEHRKYCPVGKAKAFAEGFDDGQWPAIKPEPLTQPSNLCGSLREHGPHDWVGQTTGKDLHCPGYPYPNDNRGHAKVRAL